MFPVNISFLVHSFFQENFKEHQFLSRVLWAQYCVELTCPRAGDCTKVGQLQAAFQEGTNHNFKMPWKSGNKHKVI